MKLIRFGRVHTREPTSVDRSTVSPEAWSCPARSCRRDTEPPSATRSDARPVVGTLRRDVPAAGPAVAGTLCPVSGALT
ncbi:hypothetical protein Misp04_37840 [Micromonospora sp. NBRC 101691]|nr:hypothetical protein Misp04_37840 [Micromonospora sp. NBRC 101691]